MDLRDAARPAAEVIAALALRPHPEGGYFRETWRDVAADGGRGVGTAILFLLAAGQTSHWHRIDADELWIWNAGGPLRLDLSADAKAVRAHRLGPDLRARESLHLRVPRTVWQSATPLAAWSLVTCTVAPAFRFEGFELAPPGWRPGLRAD